MLGHHKTFLKMPVMKLIFIRLSTTGVLVTSKDFKRISFSCGIFITISIVSISRPNGFNIGGRNIGEINPL
jgi:hypothetical protein